MNTLFLANANNGMSSMWTIVIFIVLIALMYFTMIKPQKKQQQKKMEMMNELKKGDNVIMIDGLHGRVDSVDKTVVIDADGIYLTFSRMAVQQILPDKTASAEAPATEEKAEKPDSEKQVEEPASKPEEDKPSKSNEESSSKE